ncbi:MAG: methionyl-tRNA formyltransferase [Elusimicrobiaceae bacterium]|nr:methionyl-tRNA formyltransferase [Elusimicrobiaceae bacterium]
MSALKTIFFGTPQLAVPYLELVRTITDLQLAVTQADKPRGRGLEISPCPVKARALELGVPVLSPEKLKDDFDKIAATPFDLGIAVAYGKIFRPDFLALPKLGILNVHFSLLPKLRGAAPVQQALIQGYTKTGISVFWIRPGMDDGPLFLQKEIAIAPQDNAQTLFEKLIPLGVEGLKEVLTRLQNAEMVQTPQLGEPTTAPMLQKEDALLCPADLTAEQLHNRVRGLACGPKPKVPFLHNGKLEWVQVLRTQLAGPVSSALPGTLLSIERTHGILVKCKEGAVWLVQVQPAGKKPMSAVDFAHGRNLKLNDRTFIENAE